MPKVTVYRFQLYDVQSDQMQTSRRWGTQEAIEDLGGHPLVHTATEIDEGQVGGEIEGLTVRDFSPNSQIAGGFQRAVGKGY